MTVLNQFLTQSSVHNLFLFAGDGDYAKVFDNLQFFHHKQIYVIGNSHTASKLAASLASGCLFIDTDKNLAALLGTDLHLEEEKASIHRQIEDYEQVRRDFDAAVKHRELLLAERMEMERSKEEEEKNLTTRYAEELARWNQGRADAQQKSEQQFWDNADALLNHVFRATFDFEGDASVSEMSLRAGAEYSVYSFEDFDGEHWFSALDVETAGTGYIRHSVLKTRTFPVDLQIPVAQFDEPEPQKPDLSQLEHKYALAEVPPKPLINVNFDLEIKKLTDKLSQLKSEPAQAVWTAVKNQPLGSAPPLKIHVEEKDSGHRHEAPAVHKHPEPFLEPPVVELPKPVEKPVEQTRPAMVRTVSNKNSPAPSAVDADPVLSSWIKPAKKDEHEDEEDNHLDFPSPAVEPKKWTPPVKTNKSTKAAPAAPTPAAAAAMPTPAIATSASSSLPISATHSARPPRNVAKGGGASAPKPAEETPSSSSSGGTKFGDVYMPSTSSKKKMFEIGTTEEFVLPQASRSARFTMAEGPTVIAGSALAAASSSGPVLDARGFADPEHTKYTLQELVSGTAAHVDPERKHEYLEDEEFQQLFGCTPNQFTKFTEFKKNQMLKDKKLI
eukprot:TRINITY_DN1507_c0_g1_i2.p1 TRINITY_DN1507_c0_g1~~TRINITY_DN1507_c0_g1_i2.p1  ORF type:complete len:613 (+),score=220.34 TRINITY_DN1507_c0_g1_i2:338-2176(+)